VTKLLLSIHVLAAIIAIGPVTVAASMFPAASRRALAAPQDQRGVAVLQNLHRICRVYAALGVLVPVFGLATARSLGVLGDPWLILSIVLTVAAAAVLALLVLPGQATVLANLSTQRPPDPVADGDASPGQSRTATRDGAERTAARLGMVTGTFNLLWAVVVVLMIVRPGSTTGA
jgi:uncharacterized membrane protein